MWVRTRIVIDLVQYRTGSTPLRNIGKPRRDISSSSMGSWEQTRLVKEPYCRQDSATYCQIYLTSWRKVIRQSHKITENAATTPKYRMNVCSKQVAKVMTNQMHNSVAPILLPVCPTGSQCPPWSFVYKKTCWYRCRSRNTETPIPL